jgi:5,6-dimethylbenzimidazole synthase
MRVRENFRLCNAEALSSYAGERAERYAALKLEGLQTAPVQFAVFCERATSQGHRLGRLTMPETLEYSVVTAVSSFWLAARAVGLGVGWVSILDPEAIRAALDCPATWRLVAYLCVGWPVEDHLDPELARLGWQARTGSGRPVLRR